MNIDELYRVEITALVAFNALMEERSVTAVAKRLHVTQPAMSRTLGRLRELFGDPLFIRTPTGLEPTRRSLELQAPVAEVLEQLARVITPSRFEPLTLTRDFRIALTDPLSAVIIPALQQRLQEQAPGVNLKLEQYSGESQRDLSKGTLDFIIGTIQDDTPAGIHARTLFQDRVCCFVSQNHPLAAKSRISLEEMVGYDHIKLWLKGFNDHGPLDSFLKSKGLSRRIRLEAPHTSTILEALKTTDWIVVGPGSTWSRLWRNEPVVALQPPPPLDQVLFPISLLWGARNHTDPAYSWFRNLVAESAAKVND